MMISPQNKLPKYAAIDIGTNAARLLIAEVLQQNGKPFINKIHYSRMPLRLGDQVFNDKRLNPDKINKLKQTMAIFKNICLFFEVDNIIAYATSAMREATNSQEIIEQIRKETGVKISVISGQQEAEIILGAISTVVDKEKSNYVVVDVGGGSTEISIFWEGEKQDAQSFEIGTLRMLKNKVDREVFDKIASWIAQQNAFSDDNLIYATGGNANKIHKILGIKHLSPISYQKLLKMKHKLKKMSVLERMQHYQLKADRAEVIVPAIEIYCFILEQLDADSLLVPNLGLSDGMILSNSL